MNFKNYIKVKDLIIHNYPKCTINKKLNADAKDVINDFVTSSKKKNITVDLIKYYK